MKREPQGPSGFEKPKAKCCQGGGGCSPPTFSHCVVSLWGFESSPTVVAWGRRLLQSLDQHHFSAWGLAESLGPPGACGENVYFLCYSFKGNSQK